jgi:hypothetical protein
VINFGFWVITRRVVLIGRRFGTPVESIFWVDQNTGIVRGWVFYREKCGRRISLRETWPKKPKLIIQTTEKAWNHDGVCRLIRDKNPGTRLRTQSFYCPNYSSKRQQN